MRIYLYSNCINQKGQNDFLFSIYVICQERRRNCVIACTTEGRNSRFFHDKLINRVARPINFKKIQSIWKETREKNDESTIGKRKVSEKEIVDSLSLNLLM